MSSPFSRELRLLLLASLGPAACSAQGGDVIVPPQPSGSGPGITIVEPVASLQRPTKDPREAMWQAAGAQCMPAWATNQQNPHPQRAACGTEPGSWLRGGGGRGRWRQYDLDADLSAREARNHAGDACCYTSYDDYPMEGRPLLAREGLGEDALVLAAPARRVGWGSEGRGQYDLSLAEHRVAALSREVAAAGWLEAARFEHASIASFARLALELLALGAPAALVASAHEAALDELRHARDAFAIASALSGNAGSELGPGVLPLERAAPPARKLVELADASLRLGCVGETLAALEAHEAAAEACPALRATLEAVARDEAQHAALAFRIVAWAARTGTHADRAEIAALARAARARTPAATPGRSAARELGRLGTEASAAVYALGMREVVGPALAAFERGLVSMPVSLANG